MINPRLPAGGRTKPPRGMAVIDRTNPVGNKVTACWLLNEGGGGRITDLVSGVSSPITMNATEANRAKWRGSPDGIPCLDLNTSIGNYAVCSGLPRVIYSRGISFLGLFRYPTAGGTSSNRCLVMTRTDGFNGLLWSLSTPTVTVTTKGWAGWNVNTGLTPPRDRLVAMAGTQTPNGDVRICMNGQRYSLTGTTYTVPTISQWYVGVDSYDVSRQWAGPVYMTAVLHGVLSWGEMEAWAREPFAFVTPRPSFRSLGILSSTFTATAGLTIRRGTLNSTATFTKPTYSGSGPIAIKAQTLAGVGTFTKPTYAGIGGLTVKQQTLVGAGTFTKPTYTGAGDLSLTPDVLNCTGTFTKPTYSGVGTFTAKAQELAGVGTVIQPSYTGSGGLSVTPALLNSSSQFTQPTYAATAGLSVKAETLASVASFSAPSYTGVGSFAIDGTDLDGTTNVTQPTYSGTGAFAIPTEVLTASGDTTQPSYTGAGSLGSAPVSLQAVAVFANPLFTGQASFNLGPLSLAGVSTFAEATGQLVVRITTEGWLIPSIAFAGWERPGVSFEGWVLSSPTFAGWELPVLSFGSWEKPSITMPSWTADISE